MNIRTDLALDVKENIQEHIPGVVSTEVKGKTFFKTEIEIKNEQGANTLGKPIGKYITFEMSNLGMVQDDYDEVADEVARCISQMIGDKSLVLVVGLGNSNITPDNIGPLTASKIFATRHIEGELRKCLGGDKLGNTAVLMPNVMGKTGMEASEVVKAVAEKVKPSAVIVVDALASRSVGRLGNTIQLCNTGVSPGAGVGNKRKELSENTLGVPVIALGVPTVVDALTIVADAIGEENIENTEKNRSYRTMMVTPREIDTLIEQATEIMALGINMALQPEFSKKEIMLLTK